VPEAAGPVPRVSFIVPVRNDAARLERCLASIAITCGDTAYETIVADNGSTDRSPEVARAAGAAVMTMPGLRVSEMRNTAAARARAALLAFIDADHALAHDWMQGLALLADPAVAAVGAQYHAPVDGTWVQRMYDRLRRHQAGVRDTGWLPSGNLVVRTEVFRQLGGFDTSLETCEDVDLCQRLVAGGGRLMETDRMHSTHFGDPATLRALFFGELWRGRDNLKVSLRGPLTPRELPSIILPIFNLVGLVLFVAGLIALPVAGPEIAAAGFVMLGLVTLLRWAALMRPQASAPFTPGAAVQALAVAFTYTTARSLALVVRTGHDVRKRG